MSVYSERLEQQADLLWQNVAGFEQKALQRIGERIRSIGKLSVADAQAINNMAFVKQDMQAIIKELARITGKNIAEVNKIYNELISSLHDGNKFLYDYRGKTFIPFERNQELQAMVRAWARTSGETMINLSMTKALGLINKHGNFIGLQKYIYDAYGKAVAAVATGASDFNSAVRDTVRELGGSGMRVRYDGIKRRLDTAARQNVLWGAKQVAKEYNEKLCKELGCDGIEVDWHNNPRPNHEFMQGKQYALGGRKTVNGVTYESADRALEALEDYGCLHFSTPIILGVSEPTYSTEELHRLNEQNKRTFDIDGKQMTGYECRQSMRRLETEVRKQRDIKTTAQASGDNVLVRECNEKIKVYTDKYNQIADASGIKPQYQRMGVVKKSENVLTTQKNTSIINVGGDAMYRKKKAEGYIEPMPKKQLLRIEKAFKRNGGVIQRSEKVDEYLALRDAEGITLNAETILLVQHPGRASVFEELIHTSQYSNGKNDGSLVSRLKCEVEAQEKLLKHAKAYQLTKEEIIQTRNALEIYRNELAEYTKILEV